MKNHLKNGAFEIHRRNQNFRFPFFGRPKGNSTQKIVWSSQKNSRKNC